MPGPIWFIVTVVLLAGAAAAFFFLGITYRRRVAEREINGAEERAKSIINDSIKAAEAKKREALLEAKEEIHKNRSDYEREVKERRAEIAKEEDRIRQKEEALDKKTDALDKKTDDLDKKMDALDKKSEAVAGRIAELDAAKEEIALVKRSQVEMLEKISGYTVEEAKEYLIRKLESEVTHEAAMKLKDVEERYKEEAERKAREYISLAIQRVASDYVVEATVSVVPLPNDEMKGRIIGREGRNVRSLETLTGVDFIIDDTPEAITLSSFDPVRREVARISLEKLILDGRIHPARIEEMVEKAKREVDAVIKEEGDRATFETGVHGLNPEIVKLLGRMRYRTSYGQNVLAHSIEVSHVAGVLASELGVDVMTAKRAGLLHDIGKSIDHEVEGSHVMIGVDIARKYKESEAIVHAIEAHHGDVEPRTVIACIVQAADAISASRPGARRENIENYVKRLEKLEDLTKSFPGVESCYAIQAGREIRVMVKPEEVSEDRMILLAREIAKRIEAELEYPGQIKVNLFRETKAVEYAK
jgi:ribonuclease Y